MPYSGVCKRAALKSPEGEGKRLRGSKKEENPTGASVRLCPLRERVVFHARCWLIVNSYGLPSAAFIQLIFKQATINSGVEKWKTPAGAKPHFLG